MFKVDPDGLVTGAVRYAGNVRSSRTANTECGNRNSLRETLYCGSGDKASGAFFVHCFVSCACI
jgi:hypothetical protein